jgi:hypothetical protein
VPARPNGIVDVIDIGVTVGEDGVHYPTAVLDAADRPDVTDLARVHAVEGVGDLTTTFTAVPGGLLLTIRITRPVVVTVPLRFTLPDHLPVLEGAALTGHLLLASTPPAASGDNPLWLAVDLDGPALMDALRRTAGGTP